MAGCSRAALLADPPIATELAARYAALLDERVVSARPLAHLLGTRGFWDLLLAVDARVLTPRPESELLLETLFAELDRGALPDGPVADRGTGSGCLALAAAARRAVLAVDRSADALAVARLNRERLARGEALPEEPQAEGRRRAARVLLVHADGLSALAPACVAAVLANPPYVRPEEHATLAREVREHEPRAALVPVDGDVGAEFLRVARESAAALAPGGLLLMEVGAGDAELAAQQLRAAGLVQPLRARDLAGHERVVGARRPA